MKYNISKYLQIFVLLLSAIIFTPSLNGDFLNWDDRTYITGNEILNEDISISSFKEIYEYDANISLSLFSFQLQTKLFGDSPFYFHLINILIHLINIFLVFYLTKILFGNMAPAFWVALIFAIHPYRVESVAWIMQRKDLLFTMFFLLGTLFYIKFIKTDKILFYLITIILAYLAILSKISAISFGATLLIIEFYLNNKITPKSLLFVFIICLAQLTSLDSFSFFMIYTSIPLIIISTYNKLYKSQLSENNTINKSNVIKYNLKRLLYNSKTINFVILFYLILLIATRSSTILFIVQKTETPSIDIFKILVTYFLPILILFIINNRNQQRISKFITYFKSTWKKLIILFVLLVLFILFVYYESIPKFEHGAFSLTDITSLKTLIYFSYSLMFYITGFFFPFYQISMQPYPDAESFSILFKLAPIALIVVFFLVFYFIKKMKNKTLQRETIFGLFFFLINISLVLHIIPIKGKVIVAERYTYLAYLGLIIVFVFIIKQLIAKCKAKQKKIILLFVIVLLSGYSIQAYSRSKVFKNSFTFWTDIIAKNPENHYALYALGLHYYENNDYETAINYYSKAIKLNSKNYEYYLNRGSSYLKIDSINLAIKDYDKAIELHADNPVAYKNIGILYYRTGNLENALTNLESSLKLNPNDKEVSELYSSANVLFQEYQECQSTDTSSRIVSQYFFSLANNLAAEGKYNQSLSFFNESIKFDSLNVNAYKNRGNVFAILTRFEESINDYKYALRIDTLDAGIYLNLGNVLHQSGNLKLACYNWQKALELGNSEAQKTIDQFCK